MLHWIPTKLVSSCSRIMQSKSFPEKLFTVGTWRKGFFLYTCRSPNSCSFELAKNDKWKKGRRQKCTNMLMLISCEKCHYHHGYWENSIGVVGAGKCLALNQEVTYRLGNNLWPSLTPCLSLSFLRAVGAISFWCWRQSQGLFLHMPAFQFQRHFYCCFLHTISFLITKMQ